MSKPSSQQFVSKLPKASTIAGIGLSATTLYVLYNMNARKQRFQGQIQQSKDDFNRIKKESSERFKLAREEFKCMPAVQEAQRLAKAQKLNWNEGKEQLKEFKQGLKEFLKDDSTESHQDGVTATLDFILSKEKELEEGRMALEYLLANEMMDGSDFLLMELECLKYLLDSMNGLLELLRTDEKRLGWSLEVVAAWNDYEKKRDKIVHDLTDLESAQETVATDTQESREFTEA